MATPDTAAVPLPVLGRGVLSPSPPPASHPCVRCATIQRTCCQRAEIVLSPGDAARIARHTARDDFWEDRPPADPAYLDQDDDPPWLAGTVAPDGTRRVLRRRPGGDCTFLGPSGCALPGEIRPLVCRLYPWAYTERGLEGIDDEYCPASRLVPPGRTMIDALGMDAREGERWRRMLYEELRTGRESDDHRPDLRPA